MSPDPITTLRREFFEANRGSGKQDAADFNIALDQVRTLVEAAKAHGREGYGSSPAELAATVRFHDALRPFISGDTESG